VSFVILSSTSEVVDTHFKLADLPPVVVAAASTAQQTIILPAPLWAEPKPPTLTTLQDLFVP
jgi:hypothetical protein